MPIAFSEHGGGMEEKGDKETDLAEICSLLFLVMGLIASIYLMKRFWRAVDSEVVGRFDARVRVRIISPPMPTAGPAKVSDACRAALNRRCYVYGRSVSALSMNGLLRTGNEFIRVVTGLVCCRVFQIPRFVIANYSLFLRHSFTTSQGILVDVGGRVDLASAKLEYHWVTVGMEACDARFFLEAARSIRKHVAESIPKPSVNRTTLVLHLRGEDVFPDPKLFPPAPWYGQPTCSFYLDVMDKDKGHDNVRVIAKDDWNRCMGPVIAKGAVHRKQNLSQDFSDMIWATRLAVSRSAFMRAVMYLSMVEKIWYRFGRTDMIDPGLDDYGHHIWPVIGPHEYCEPSRDYENSIMMNWAASKYDEVLKHNCTWKFEGPYIPPT
jgi:hypothetical protein